MRLHSYALACDYDGTLARQGRVPGPVVAALDRAMEAGLRLLLVTGRRMPELLEVFPECQRFTMIVAENGALLVEPSSGREVVLGPPPSLILIERLLTVGVPLETGRVILATWQPHDETVQKVMEELALDYPTIANKGHRMFLPRGIDKGTGLRTALEQLEMARESSIAIGDAENDLPMFSVAGWRVAVANALPSVKEQADWVMEADHGAGVAELIERLLGGEVPVHRTKY